MRFDVSRFFRGSRPGSRSIDKVDYLARAMAAILLVAAVAWAAVNGG